VVPENGNLYWTLARFNTALLSKTTDNLTEGTTNLYYTTARANADFDTRLSTKTTTDISEGTNLYWTQEPLSTPFLKFGTQLNTF
jgi:hypothetical protein